MSCKLGFETSDCHIVERDIYLYVCKYKFTLDNLLSVFRIIANTSHINYTQEAKRVQNYIKKNNLYKVEHSHSVKQTISLDYQILNIIDNKFFDLTKEEKEFMKVACHNSIGEQIFRDLHFMVAYNDVIFSNDGSSFEGRVYYNSGSRKIQEVRFNSSKFAKMDDLKSNNI